MSRNLATERHVSRSDDTNISALATRARGCRSAGFTSQRVLVAAGTFEYGEPVGVGSRHRDTEPSSVGDAITVAFTRPGVGGVRVPAELGDVRLAPDGLGSRQCPVRERHMPGFAPNP
jgi:hypothetical protein